MKVRLESATCEGFGTCATHAPNLFELDEWGYAILKHDGQVQLPLPPKPGPKV